MHRRRFVQYASMIAACWPFATPFIKAAIGLQGGKGLQNQENLVIETASLLQWRNQFFVRVTDASGRSGYTLCNSRMEHLSGIFNGLVAPFFIGKNAWEISRLVEEVYRDERNYKYSGMPFWNCVGHLEVAVWDLLGKASNKPVHQLLGTQARTTLPMYLSSLTRNNTAQQEGEKIVEALAATGCKAVKVKVGGRMGTSRDADQRSRDLVLFLRKHAPADCTIYADANGSYTIQEAMEMVDFLEDQEVDMLEEPCAWEDFEANKAVADACRKIKIAGGEQDSSYFRFDWYARQRGLDVLQPDTFYNGGISRALMVAALAEKYGLGFAPHSPKADPLEAPFLHLMAVAPAVYGFQEFPLSGVGKKPESWWGPHFNLSHGQLGIPDGPGLGIDYDELIWQEAKRY